MEFKTGNFDRAMGIEVIASADGKSEVALVPTEAHNNAFGRSHGGLAATLIDTAMGWAVRSKVADGMQFGTIDLSVRFVGKIDVTSGPLRVTSEVVHAGRTLLTAEAKVMTATGKILAHGSGSFLVFPGQ